MQISRRSLTLIAGVMAALLVALAGPALAATDAQRCESAVELASAKYAQCRLKAESKFTKTGNVGARSAALGNCSTKFMAKYNQAFARYGGSCPTLESENAFEVYLNQCTNEVEDAAGGGLFPACGDGAINVAGEQCDGGDLGGESRASLGFVGGTLGCFTGGCGGGQGCGKGCSYDTRACESQVFPATGQTTCWNSAGAVIACAGTGHDGEVEVGATLAYVDNGTARSPT